MRRVGVVVPIVAVLALLELGLLSSNRSGPAFAAEPAALSGTMEYKGVDVILEPPTGKPLVSADQALEIAAKEWPNATTYSGVLADYTNTAVKEDGALLLEDVTSWVVTADGVCVPVFGGRFYTGEGCAGDQIHVVVDARSGEWITSFAQQSEQG